MRKITEKLVDKVVNLEGSVTGHIGRVEVMDSLDGTVAIYVEDYFGGKVIKQEATPVTILDENGKATYAVTARKPKGDNKYILEIK